ncbi:MAG TPA: PrsW family glutamic-type intramembrane protease [Anaerolineaceae bacterium]|nr:PrsW family glutamic-type intramembrane protease [Anaerolineaceae bacterium]
MQQSGTHWPSLGQFILSSLAALGGLAVAGLLFCSGLLTLTGQTGMPAADSVPVFILTWAAALVAVLMLPSAAFSLLRLLGKRPPALEWKGRFVVASVLMFIWPLLVALSSPLGQTELAWLLLPPVMLAAILIPIWWYIEFGRRGLAVTGPQRTWGVVVFSTLVSVPAIITAEVVTILFVASGVMVWFTSRPELARRVTALIERLQTVDLTPELVERLAAPFIEEPVFLFATLFVVAVFTPLIEELLKPLAVWLAGGARLTPAQGYWLGMVSGAAFALVETLGLAGSTTGPDAASVLVARLSTGLLHIVTAGLTGWAMAATWRDGRYLRLVGAYVLAVAIHGLWNAFGVFVGFSPLITPDLALPADPLAAALTQASLPVLAGLVVINLVILFWMNRQLRRSEMPAVNVVESTAG